MSELFKIPKSLTPEERKLKIKKEQARQEAIDRAIRKRGLFKIPKSKKYQEY